MTLLHLEIWNTSLHSTMYLLILDDRMLMKTCARCFTFHYVSINIWLRSFYAYCQLSLHSTMYLLICKMHLTNNMKIRFTFHYVSINIFYETTTWVLPRFFTFHYVSINIYKRQGVRKSLASLHSTMYLLISIPRFPLWNDIFLYIPLCIY